MQTSRYSKIKEETQRLELLRFFFARVFCLFVKFLPNRIDCIHKRIYISSVGICEDSRYVKIKE